MASVPRRAASVGESRSPGFAPIGLTLPRAPARSVNVEGSSEHDVQGSVEAERSAHTASRRLSDVGWSPSPRVAPKTSDQWRKEHNRLGLNLGNVVENIDKARNAGVEPARNTWLKKLAGVAVSGLFTAGLVVAGVATGGAGFAVAAALSGLYLAKMSADAACAKALLNDARKEAAGEALVTRRLPMGGDSIGNLIHWCMPASINPDTRMKVAGTASFLLNLGLGVTATVLSGGALAMPAAMTIGVAHTGLFIWSVATHGLKNPELKDADGVMLDNFIDVKQQTDALWEDLLNADIPVDQRARLLTRLKTANEAVMGTMDAAVDRVAEQVEAATVLHGKRVEGVRAEVGAQVADNVASEAGIKVVLDPVLSAGKLLLTGVNALSAHRERREQLDDVNTFRTVASEVQAELSRLRLQAMMPDPTVGQAVDQPSMPDADLTQDELISAARMQAHLRDI